jgi:hypothetical protein
MRRWWSRREIPKPPETCQFCDSPRTVTIWLGGKKWYTCSAHVDTALDEYNQEVNG